MSLALQFLINTIVNASLYALLAISFGIVLRSLNFFHLALGGIYVVASYTSIYLIEYNHLNILFAIILSFLISIALSLTIDKIVYQPILKKNGGAGVLLIASLGVLIILENMIALTFGSNLQILPNTLTQIFQFNGLIITFIQSIQFIISTLLILFMYFLIKKHPFFKLVWAIGDNEVLLKALGLPYNTIRNSIFIISSIFITTVSLLNTFDVGIDPHLGMHYLLFGAIATIIGGINNYRGWIIGAFMVALAESISAYFLSSQWNDVVIFSILIFILLFHPNGIISTTKRVKN